MSVTYDFIVKGISSNALNGAIKWCILIIRRKTSPKTICLMRFILIFRKITRTNNQFLNDKMSNSKKKQKQWSFCETYLHTSNPPFRCIAPTREKKNPRAFPSRGKWGKTSTAKNQNDNESEKPKRDFARVCFSLRLVSLVKSSGRLRGLLSCVCFAFDERCGYA